jgi:ribosomal protein L32E
MSEYEMREYPCSVCGNISFAEKTWRDHHEENCTMAKEEPEEDWKWYYVKYLNEKETSDKLREALKQIKAHEVYDLNAVQVATDMVRIAERALR